MTAVYSPRVMETHLVKVQQTAMTVFGVIISIIFIIYLITEICKEIKSVSNDQNFNMSDIHNSIFHCVHLLQNVSLGPRCLFLFSSLVGLSSQL